MATTDRSQLADYVSNQSSPTPLSRRPITGRSLLPAIKITAPHHQPTGLPSHTEQPARINPVICWTTHAAATRTRLVDISLSPTVTRLPTKEED